MFNIFFGCEKSGAEIERKRIIEMLDMVNIEGVQISLNTAIRNESAPYIKIESSKEIFVLKFFLILEIIQWHLGVEVNLPSSNSVFFEPKDIAKGMWRKKLRIVNKSSSYLRQLALELERISLDLDFPVFLEVKNYEFISVNRTQENPDYINCGSRDLIAALSGIIGGGEDEFVFVPIFGKLDTDRLKVKLFNE